ncbi:MAG TPA: hypothetical protein VG125_14430 [Pirellulales bacterium]|jgi:hypothetical protein|nr:hypothetical protein [Pirellulales bacterium]
MSRRFQFSLRALLGLVTVLCLLLGGWGLLLTYGQFVAAGPITLHERIALRGRLIRMLGPKRLPYCIWIDPDGGVFDHAERSWLCIYTVQTETVVAHQPGRYRLTLVDLENPVGAIPPGSPTVLVTVPEGTPSAIQE